MPPDHPGQDVLLRTLHAVPISSPAYEEAVAEMHYVAGERGLDAVFRETGADVLFSLGDGGRHSLANMVGYPMGASLRFLQTILFPNRVAVRRAR